MTLTETNRQRDIVKCQASIKIRLFLSDTREDNQVWLSLKAVLTGC